MQAPPLLWKPQLSLPSDDVWDIKMWSLVLSQEAESGNKPKTAWYQWVWELSLTGSGWAHAKCPHPSLCV